MTRPTLAVWLYGTQIGELTEPRPGRLELTWSEQAYQRWGGGSRVVSHLLPVALPGQQPNPPRLKVFIDGLLPEGNARTNYAMDAGLPADDTFGLIARYGRDTAGALVFQPLEEHVPPRAGRYTPLKPDEVGQRLLDADRHAPTDPLRRGVQSISLAGIQPKIGLHRLDGKWYACQDGAPSTWILKLAQPEGSPSADVVDTEALCAELARAVGLSTVSTFVVRVGQVRAIAVERYDRVVMSHTVQRIHQEDIAQALGIDTADPERKFQRGRLLPSLVRAADVLRAGGSEPDQLLRLATFNHAVGNTDFQAKNISVVRRADGTASLAPAYDSSMHLHHGTRDPLSALDVNGMSAMYQISFSDLVQEGVSWGLPRRRAHVLVAELVDDLDAALAAVDLTGHPGVPEVALTTVRQRVRSALAEVGPIPAARSTGRSRPRRRRS